MFHRKYEYFMASFTDDLIYLFLFDFFGIDPHYGISPVPIEDMCERIYSERRGIFFWMILCRIIQI